MIHRAPLPIDRGRIVLELTDAERSCHLTYEQALSLAKALIDAANLLRAAQKESA